MGRLSTDISFDNQPIVDIYSSMAEVGRERFKSGSKPLSAGAGDGKANMCIKYYRKGTSLKTALQETCSDMVTRKYKCLR